MWLDDPNIDLRWILTADILHLQRACERGGVPLTVFRPDQSENARLALTDRTATVVHPSRDCPSGREFMVVVAHLLVSGQPFNFQVAGFDHRDGSLRGLLRLNPSISQDTLRMLTDIGLTQDRAVYEEMSQRIEEAFAGLRRQISHSPIVLEED
ncbi:hypothetical protein STAQ_03860 [Allostella sp. ATCC 35155]|nr:hypothetical protein STAQ_03860 [Stella sp. ATCC 35155]